MTVDSDFEGSINDYFVYISSSKGRFFVCYSKETDFKVNRFNPFLSGYIGKFDSLEEAINKTELFFYSLRFSFYSQVAAFFRKVFKNKIFA